MFQFLNAVLIQTTTTKLHSDAFTDSQHLMQVARSKSHQ